MILFKNPKVETLYGLTYILFLSKLRLITEEIQFIVKSLLLSVDLNSNLIKSYKSLIYKFNLLHKALPVASDSC